MGRTRFPVFKSERDGGCKVPKNIYDKALETMPFKKGEFEENASVQFAIDPKRFPAWKDKKNLYILRIFEPGIIQVNQFYKKENKKHKGKRKCK